MTSPHTPFLYTSLVYEWLDTSLDYGISEADFWNSTIAELNRLIASKDRVHKRQLQERASMDYTLAQMIGRAIGITIGGDKKPFPKAYEFYPTVFDREEMERQEREKRLESSVSVFKRFADSVNQKFNKEVAKIE